MIFILESDSYHSPFLVLILIQSFSFYLVILNNKRNNIAFPEDDRKPMMKNFVRRKKCGDEQVNFDAFFGALLTTKDIELE